MLRCSCADTVQRMCSGLVRDGHVHRRPVHFVVGRQQLVLEPGAHVVLCVLLGLQFSCVASPCVPRMLLGQNNFNQTKSNKLSCPCHLATNPASPCGCEEAGCAEAGCAEGGCWSAAPTAWLPSSGSKMTVSAMTPLSSAAAPSAEVPTMAAMAVRSAGVSRFRDTASTGVHQMLPRREQTTYGVKGKFLSTVRVCIPASCR